MKSNQANFIVTRLIGLQFEEPPKKAASKAVLFPVKSDQVSR